MRKSTCAKTSCRVSTIVSSSPKKVPKVSSESPLNAIPNVSNESRIRHYFAGFHRRYWKKSIIHAHSYDLLVSRLFVILIWCYTILIEFLGFSTVMHPPTTVMHFLFLSSYSLKDIYSLIYASGAAMYGMSIEIYLILPWTIVNCIFAIHNCGMYHGETRASIISIVKSVSLFAGTELSYQNFKRFKFQQSYQLHCQVASRAMLRQCIFLTVTIIFLVCPGLRCVYNGVRFRCLYSNRTMTDSSCDLIDLERPMFDEHFSCVADYTGLITGMEELRIIRDITLCSIAFYSMYNKAFLDITGKSSFIHKVMLVLFFAMSCSIVAVNIDPLHFGNIKLYFNLIEIIIFFTLIILLILNLQYKYEQKQFVIMQESPTIFG